MIILSGARPRPFSRCIILALLALVIAAVPSGRGADAAPRAQPDLLAFAAQHPEQPVSVIVQKQVHDTSVEQLAARLGGVVTSDLHIINAFAARLRAGAALELARAAGVRWVSLDAPVVRATACTPCVGSTKLKNTYIRAIGADRIWNEAPHYQGQGIGVAVVDSGVTHQADFYTPMGANRISAMVAFNDDYNRTPFDGYGHGTHVAGIIGGDGELSAGAYIGVAPMVNLINVKVSNDNGGSNASNVVKGLQWVNDNRNIYNIKVVNLSLNSSVAESYHTNPIAAAVEILWFNKVVVVVSAGNKGKNALFPPANDPFVITVGAADDRGTASTTDDVLASYSGFGITTDGFSKPDLVAPGSNIISVMPNPNNVLALGHPGNVVDRLYLRMSGTSMAAPVVAGTAALLLQANPNLTPDQVKFRLMATARPFDKPQRAGAGFLDAYAALHSSTTASANTGIPASQLLWSGSAPVTWNSVNWNSVNWNSVNWNSVNWNSVNWNSVNWNSDYWGK
jgi:serine protease AprX